uniref:DUF6141 family protein n=1 Tax=Roseihalotalea indica TaxID=2867963 RepID=A0AA49JFZ1_9BACT|nr:DUF6141 family protein [Tunicatimonas sp. TK19036]
MKVHDTTGSIFFSERQHFRQPWLWFLLLGMDGMFIYGLIKQVVLGKPFGDNPISNSGLVVVASLVFLLTLLIAFLRLDTVIKKDGIYYRFLPLQLAYKKIAWDRLAASYVRQYSPIGEYGGWGLRLGIFGRGKAFNVSGNQGLQLVYDDGKKFLLGTQHPDEIKQALLELGQLKPENQ